MTTRNLDRFFKPSSVAVVGASHEKLSVGQAVLNHLVEGTYEGSVYPVNPKYKELGSVPCYARLSEIGRPVDLAVICTPPHSVPKIIEDCGQAGIAAAIILSAGFREIGTNGLLLEEEIKQIAKSFPGMRIVGPNCLGILSPYHGLNASFSVSSPALGSAAFISQSGALCTSILDWAAEAGIGFSAVASLGNSLDVDLSDLIDYFAADPYTKSIVMYVESIKNARHFMSAARAFTRTKPIIAFKAGRFLESAKATVSHTGAMVGEDHVYDAAFARAGIVRVHEMSELFSCAEVLSRGKLPCGPKLAIVSNAGGPGVMAVDALIGKHGSLAKLSQETVDSLNKILPPMWSKQNPIDILGDACSTRFGGTLELVLQDEGVDGVIVILTPQSMTDPLESAKAIVEASRHSRKPVLAVWMGGASVHQGVKLLQSAGISTFQTPEQAVAAFENLYQYHYRRNAMYETPLPSEHLFTMTKSQRDAVIPEKVGLLNEVESKAVLNAYDIPTNETLVAKDAMHAVALAHQLSGPFAMKVVSTDVVHKSDAGGVMLNVIGVAAVENSFGEIVRAVSRSNPNASIDGVSIQSMVTIPCAIELILGVKRDVNFGSVLMIGAGGTIAELIEDRALELPPLNYLLARRMLESLRIWPLLNGYRNRPAVDIDMLVNVLIRLSYLVAEHPEIRELDINPFVVSPTASIAVDARIVLDRLEPLAKAHDFNHLAIRPYPEEWTRNITLAKGQKVTLRAIRPEDEPMWIQLLNACSKSTIHNRFGGLFSEFDHSFASQFCFVDYDREIAIVAEAEVDGQRRLLGVGRLIADSDRNHASLTFLVGDDWQSQGLGSSLADLCLEVSRRWNLTAVMAETTAENFHARQLLRDRNFKESVGSDGIVIAKLAT